MPRSGIPRPFRKPYFQTAFSFGALLSAGGDDMVFLRRSVMWVRLRQNNFYFRHRDHRQVADEEKEERQENAEGADERPDIDPGRVKHSPGGREEIAVEATDDDDETLEPHAGVDAHADEIDDVDVVPETFEPKELR